MARIRLDRGAIARVIQQASMRELRIAAPQVVNRAKILAPVDTGRLRAAIGPPRYSRSLTFRAKATISVGVDYAKFVHDGTRPHIIRPRRAEALRFVVGGRVVYARVVRHPGTRARPFLDRALREVIAGRGYRIRAL